MSVRAAFFDVDNTIIRGASSFQLARGLFLRGMLKVKDIFIFSYYHLQYLLRGENHKQIAQIRKRALHLIRGRSVAEILAVGEDVYDEVLAHRIFAGTKALIDSHLEAGHEVWLVSATPIEIGELIARRLGATGALGTVATHENGIYTGALEGELMHGPHKASAVRHLSAERNIDLAKSYVYGDSINDLPMLNLVGQPCAINPDRKLRKYAKIHGWPTRDFLFKPAKRGPIFRVSLAGLAWFATLIFRSLRKKLLKSR